LSEFSTFHVYGFIITHINTVINTQLYIYRVFQDKSPILQEDVPQVKLHQYNQKYWYLKLNSYGGNGQICFKELESLYIYWVPIHNKTRWSL
jgi:hypothetical protein